MKSIDLEHGVVPVSKVASSLAALIKRAREDHQPIVITQKGYPSGVLLGIELFAELQGLVARQQSSDSAPAPDTAVNDDDQLPA
ncbi:MAG: type II toxin-antitoxin system Phd/YefM family antitoxin [Chloroflexales bacterium]